MFSLYANRVIAFLYFQSVKLLSPRPKLLTVQRLIGNQMPDLSAGTGAQIT